jgi:hypothetical protein
MTGTLLARSVGRIMRRRLCFIVCLALWAFPGLASAREADGIAQGATTPLSFSFDYSNFGSIIAGVAGDADVAFVGEPLSGAVAVLSRITGRQIAELPPPPGNGFVLPFIMHTVGKGRLAVLDAGGLPQPKPFVPAHPVIYQYNYGYTRGSFEARLERTVSFDSVTIGFPEDFVHLGDARYLLSDAVLGSIWVAQPDGTITPGIVPNTFDPQDLIPTLAFCPTMPEISVNGYPFLFAGSTIPGIPPLAARDGTVYFYSPWRAACTPFQCRSCPTAGSPTSGRTASGSLHPRLGTCRSRSYSTSPLTRSTRRILTCTPPTRSR